MNTDFTHVVGIFHNRARLESEWSKNDLKWNAKGAHTYKNLVYILKSKINVILFYAGFMPQDYGPQISFIGLYEYFIIQELIYFCTVDTCIW